MTVDRAEVERIAALARLRLGDEEADRLTEEMNRILEHATRLRRVAEGSARQDEVEAPARSGTRSVEAEQPDALRLGLEVLAPETTHGFFLVPPPPGVTHDGGLASDTADE